VRAMRLRTIWFIAAAISVAGCGKSPEELQHECTGGVAASCFDLGEKYAAGQNVAQDKNRAIQYFERACEGRDSRGCHSARQIFQEACDGGSAIGCSNLGRIHLDGFGVPQDFSKAAEFYDKACGFNDPISCSNLGMLYADGNGVAQNLVKARELYAKACQHGFADACSKVSNEP
jgi:TPR repeat protein